MATNGNGEANGTTKRTKPRPELAAALAATSGTQKKRVSISAPKITTAAFQIRGLAPYVQNKFSHKAAMIMQATQEAGQQARNKKNRPAKDFNACYNECMYATKEGWRGIPASAFRAAMVSACRVSGLAMTMAKLTVFVVADCCDKDDETPLVRITSGTPRQIRSQVRNDNGSCDIRARAMWDKWTATLRVEFDEDQFSITDVANLLMRAGRQVGIGEGRPDSKNSSGMGWGTFTVEGEAKRG